MSDAFDIQSTAPWLERNIPGFSLPFTAQLVGNGRSNLTFRITDADSRSYVLRRPPTGELLATAHDMAREFRIISAIEATGVPVPRPIALCTDERVCPQPFYVMSCIDGVILDSPDGAQALTEDARKAASRDLIDVLASLHAVDVDAVGLGNLARRGGYIERQLKRWSKQWADSKTRDLPSIERVAELLGKSIPPPTSDVVVHGDYRIGNCVLNPSTGAIAGVLDWELCTLGDPLADVGYLRVYWTDNGEEGVYDDPTAAGGFLQFDDLLERYATATGRDVSGIDYYVAFSYWRLAVISEGVYARFSRGAAHGLDVTANDLSVMKSSTEHLAQRALESSRRAFGSRA
jgi:aminoglycoside phosphotransferase (APT) family kinase protein